MVVRTAARVFQASFVLALGCGAIERNTAGGGGISAGGLASASAGTGIGAGAPASGGNSSSSSGAGGAATVPLPVDECACADERFEVSLVSDGELVELAYNAPASALESSCEWSATPLRGHTYWGCGGRYLSVHACAAEGGGFPCVSISGRQVEYVDAQGRTWVGDAAIQSDANPQTTYSAGSARLDLTSAGVTRTWNATFRLCGVPGPIVPC